MASRATSFAAACWASVMPPWGTPGCMPGGRRSSRRSERSPVACASAGMQGGEEGVVERAPDVVVGFGDGADGLGNGHCVPPGECFRCG